MGGRYQCVAACITSRLRTASTTVGEAEVRYDPDSHSDQRCDRCVSQFAHRSATTIVGRLVFAAGMVGMIEASTTQSPSTPCIFPWGSTTAMLSVASPIRHVPT